MDASTCARPVEALERRTLLSIIPVGSEFRVNTSTISDQVSPAVATDADGDFVVAWQGVTAAGWGLFVQRYDQSGVPQGGEAQVPTLPVFQRPATNPAVAMDADGDFVVAWRQPPEPGLSYGIYVQRYNAVGGPQGQAFRVNAHSVTNKHHPAVAMSGGGSFVVVWQSEAQDGAGYGIYARQFNASGVPIAGEFRVNTHTTGSQTSPGLGIAPDGRFAITWEGAGPDGEASGVFARLYRSDGLALTNQFTVHAPNADFDFASSVMVRDDGDVVVGWTREDPQRTDRDVYARRFSAAGEPRGDEFRVSTHTTGDQGAPAVACDADGNFVVAWDSFGQDGDEEGVYAQRFDADGVARGSELRVNTYTAGWQSAPALAMDGAGDSLVVWQSESQDGSLTGVYAQRIAIVPTVTASSFLYATAPHRLRFTFDQNVSASLGVDDVVLENLTSGQTIPSEELAVSYDAATNAATFRYTGTAGGIAGVLPDGNYRTTLLASGITNAGGTPLAADVVFTFTFLQGDATGDARVNLDDFNVLAANFGQGGRDFTQGDFSYDGVVNLDDFNILASRFGGALGPPGGFSAPRLGAGSDEAWRRVTDDPEDDLL